MVGVGCSGLVPCAAASAACVVSIDGVVSYGEARLAPSCHLPPHPTPSNPPPPPPPQEFDSKGWTTFAPHYIVWTCPAAYRSSAECASQCIRHGRYCSPDPDGDMHKGYSGADVVQVGGWVCEGMLLLLPSICCCCLPSAAAAFILTLPPPPPPPPPPPLTFTYPPSLPPQPALLQENLRQLCVFTMANASGRPYLWWDYVTLFGEQCVMETKQYGQECAEKVRLACPCVRVCVARVVRVWRDQRIPWSFRGAAGVHWIPPASLPPDHLPPPPPHDPPSQVFAAINKDSWSSVDALRQCIGGQGDDAPHPVMDAQLKAQHGDDATGEVRGRVATAETYACCCVASFVLRCVHNSDSPTLCTAADHVLCGVASP